MFGALHNISSALSGFSSSLTTILPQHFFFFLVSFCFITKWISYTYTYIPISPPSCVSLPPSLSHPSRWSQSTDQRFPKTKGTWWRSVGELISPEDTITQWEIGVPTKKAPGTHSLVGQFWGTFCKVSQTVFSRIECHLPRAITSSNNRHLLKLFSCFILLTFLSCFLG